MQTLITNLDQLAIVFACAEPNPDLWRIDRWLVAAGSNGIEPLIIANKRDLTDEATFQANFGDYIRIGYRVIATRRTGKQRHCGLAEGVTRSYFRVHRAVGRREIFAALIK